MNRRAGRPSVVTKLSVAQLINEVERRRASIATQLNSLNAQLADLDSLHPSDTNGRSQTLPAAHRGRKGRGRGGNAQSLSVLIQSLLKGRTLGIGEIAEAAKNAGHKSKSKNFRGVVSLALLNHRGMFKRVARGQYTAK